MVETTQIITEQEDDKTPVTFVHKTEELIHDTVTPLVDLLTPEKARIIEEAPEEVKVTEVVSKIGDKKAVKTTKRVIKKQKGPKQEVTEIITVEKDGEEPVTTVTVSEDKSPEEIESQPIEIVEFPEESMIEEIKSPDGKSKQKKITKRTIKKKVGPRVDTTHITTTHEEDKAPVISVHTTHEFTDDTLTTLDDLHEPVHAQVIEEAPEEVKVTQTVTEQGDTKTVKTTKRVIKKPKGLKQEVTEITTVENEGEEPVTTVTVREEKSPEEGDTQTTEIVELPEETFVERVESPEGKPKQKKTTKRIIKKKVGPKLETTQIITEQDDDETPVTFVHKTEELIHDTVTPLVDLLTPEKARIIEEAPEEVKVTEVVSKIGDKKTVKTTKRVIKKQKGPKQEVTEIITVEKDGEEPVTTVTVSEDKSPEEVESQPIEIVELPEESTIEEIKSPDGKFKQKKITKRTIKKKVGPRVDTTHITTTHEEDKAPVISVHTTHEFTDDTLNTLDDLHEPVHAQVIEEAPEEVKVTQTVTEQGDTKTVKTTKRVIKKPKGLKQEVTEITTVENEGEEPVTTVTVREEKSPEEGDTQTTEIVELPEETFVESVESPEGKPKQKKTTKRIIKKKVGPKLETTQIITEQEDDETPVTFVHKTEELIHDTVTPLVDLLTPEKARIIEEAPEEVKVTEVVSKIGDKKTVKTTKRVIKKQKGPKQEVTEIITVEKDGEEPVTTVTVSEDKSPEEVESQPIEIVELPEESTIEEIKSPDGKFKQKKITKRTIKKKVGPRVDTTQITTTHEEDKAPVISVHTTNEFTDDTLTTLDDLHEPVHAQVIEEAPEEVKVTQTVTEQGDTKTVKTTKRVIKKPKGLKQEVTEITTVENEGEEPVTTVTVREEKSPEDGDTQTTEIVELPEETFVESVESPEGKPKQKKTTKRIIKKKVGPKLETTQIITEQEDDETPVTFVHKTEELIHDTVTPLVDLLTPEKARIIEEAPEEVKVTEVVSKIGDKKTVKTTKRVIKKQKGPKQEVTEIITVEKDGEEPVTTVTVSEDKSPEEVESQPIEIVELPEESTIEEIKSPDGKFKQKKITKRTIKKKVGPRVDTTQITTTHEEDKAPVISVHTTNEFTDDTLTTLDDLHEPVHAQVIEEAPEEVKVTQTVTEQGDTKTVKTTKRVIKKPKGLKQEVTEITTVENEGEEPVTTVTVREEKSPEDGDTQTTEIVELPEETFVESVESPEGKPKQKKTTKRIIKKKVGPKLETTQIITEQEDDETPVTFVHKTEELIHDTVTPLVDLLTPEKARIIEEAPEEVKVTEVVSKIGDKKTVKTTKRVIKKQKGPKQELTEIITVEKDGEEPVSTVTVSEDKSPEEVESQPIEIVELPEESTIEEIKSPDGKFKQKKITKRTIKKKVGPRVDTTQITTTHEEDKAPVISVHTTHEFTDDTLTTLDDLHEPVHAQVIEEAPEEVKVTQTVTEQGDTKTVKTTKRVIKKPKGLKQEVTEITTVENEGEEPVTTVTVTEEKSPEEVDTQTTEIVELPEETFVESVESPEGKPKQKKTTKRIIKKKVGPKLETTQIITEQEDDETPVTFVHKTEELIHDTVTPLVDLLTPEKARIIEEAPEEVKVTEVVSKIGDKKTVKTTKRVIKKQKGPKQEVTEIITVEKDGEEPVTTVTVSEDKSPEEVESQPIEIVELPEESTIEEIKSPDGKFKQKKITKRTIKKKVGPRVDTTQITTTHEEDKAPVISVHTTNEFTDDTLTTLDDLHEPVHAQVIEEAPEEVKVTQTVTEQGDTKTVKTTKRVIKKPKGLKQEVTEITTVENEGEEPVTTVTVREEKSPEDGDTQTTEIVELPEETFVESVESPEGKPKQKKTTKRIIKKKVGPKLETTQIITEQEDDETPVTFVHKTEELIHDTVTPLVDLLTPEKARIIEEAPEEVKVTEVVSKIGDKKTVKTTKRVIKKQKGPKQELTEIITVEKDGEEPVSTVTVSEDKSPEEVESQPIEIVELPEESTIEEIKSPDGKFKQKKITKRTIKKKVGPRVDTTQITTTHEEDKAPVISVHTTHEFTDDTLTTLDDLHEPVHAQVIEEAPEEVKVTQTVTEQGDTKTVKTTKRVIKKPKGLKQEVTEITTVENEGEEPVTTVTVTEEKSPEEVDTQTTEIVELPEETFVESVESPEGKPKQKKTTKRIIKKKVGPKLETTQIITEQEDDETPVTFVHKTEELIHDTVTPLVDLFTPEKARIIEEAPEEVKVTEVVSKIGDKKTVKTTKRVIKKQKGPKQEVTEIITVEKDGEEPVTTVTVSEDKSPEEVESQPIEIVELPEESTIEEIKSPDGKFKQKKITKRTIKKKVGPRVDTTQITTTHEEDKAPVISVHTTHEFTDDTLTTLDDLHEPVHAQVIQEAPEEVKVTRTVTEQGDTKTVKTTKRVIKKPKGLKQEVTEITTVENEGEEPVTTVTVREEKSPEEGDTQTTEIVELPEETFVESVESPEGKPKQKKTTKRIIKKKVGPKLETTQIITEQEDDETPITFVHKIEELIHDTVTPLVDLLTPEKARIIEEAPEEVKVTEVVSKIGDKKTVKATKRVIKKQKGPKQEVTEIITVEKDGEEPVTTVTVSEDKSPEEVESQPIEIVELPEESTIEEIKSPDGKFKQKKITKRTIKKKVGPRVDTTQITTTHEEDKAPVISVHTTHEFTDDTLTTLDDLHEPVHAQVIEEAPEEVKVTQTVTEQGDTKTVKTTKRVIKKPKGLKQEVTEITTVENEGEEPVITVTVTEEKSPEEGDTQTTEIVELPEETFVESVESPEGKPKQKKTTKRIIKKKVGPKLETTQIITEQEDDETPVTFVHKTEELIHDTVTPLVDLLTPEKARIIEEAPEEVKVTEVVSKIGDKKTVKTTKRVIKKQKGPKQEVTEIITVEKDGEEPVTTVTVSEDKSPEEAESQPIEIVELPEESTIEEIKSPDGKFKQKKITKRTIKKKVGPRVDTTQITTTHEEDKAPVISVHTTHEFTDDTLTTLDDLHEPVHAQVIEEAPEEVKVTQTVTEQGDTKTVKTTKRVIKKPKGLKQEVTEITTVENEGEEPVTTVTVREEKSPEEGETQTTEIVELPEETFVENVESPEGKPQQKKTTKRIIKKKVGPKLETIQIITEQEDDETPVTFVHKTEELIHDTVTPLVDLLTPEKARIIEEAPEEVKVTEVVSKIGDKKTIKTTKRVIKKQKGPKQEVTEIITIEKDGEEPVTTVTVSEDKSPEEVESQPIEIVELPEESTIEEIKSPDGKSKQKKITKRTIKKKVGPRVDTTHITTTHEDDKAPVVAVHTTHEFTDDTLTTLDDLHEPVHAQVIEEAPEEVKVTQTVTEQGDTKTVKTTKRVIKKPKGLKQEVTEITTVENEGEEPVTTVTVREEKSPEEGDTQTTEIVELPEESTIEEIKSPDGKSKQKKITKRTIKKKVGPRVDTTHITTTHEDDKAPVVSVHTTHEFTDDTLTIFDDLHEPVHAQVIEEAPEEVKVTQTVTEQGDTKTVKTTKRVIKKPKGLKQEVTEITTVENEGEEPVTTVTVTEEKSPEEVDTQTTEIVELPEETFVESVESPEGKPKQKKTTKRIIKKKVGPKLETTQIITEQEDDESPVTFVHKTEELIHDTVTPLVDLLTPEKARIIEEAPEEVKVTEVVSKIGDKKTVKTTKRVIKKQKGPKQEVTEIITIEKDGEEPVTTVTVSEDKSPEEVESQPIEIVELPEESTIEENKSPDGKFKQKKITKRTIKKKVGPRVDTTHITTTHEDDKAPVVAVHTTHEFTDDTLTTLDDLHEPVHAQVIEEAPEEVKVTQTVTEQGDTKTVKTTKRVIKKPKGLKQEVTEITTVENEGEEPVTTVTVREEKSPEEGDTQTTEIVELPEESTIEEIKSPDGKSKQKKITKRTIKKKVGPRVDTTHITTTHEDDKAPVVSVHTTHEFTDDTLTIFDDLHEPVHAQVIEEAPEEVKVTQTVTEQGDTKTVKTTKRVIKKPKGLKQEVTEITTVENEGEEPATTVTVTEEKSPEEGDTQTTEIVELPEETFVESVESPEGKPKQKKTTKRIIKKKVGPKLETTQIITEQEDDETPVTFVHKTEELIHDTVTPLVDLLTPEKARIIEEAPEEVKVTEVVSKIGDKKTVKTTKRVIKKQKGPKQEVTEIITVEKDGEESVTTVTVSEDKSPEEVESQPIEIVELPEESTIEEIKSPDGKFKQKKITKRTIKKKVGPRVDTTQITTTHEEDKAPVISVHTIHEFTDDTFTTLDDLHEPVHAQVIEEAPEEVKVTQTVTEQGDTKTVKTTKRVIKKPKGLKQEVTEITTVENEGEEPVTTVTVTEEKSPEEGETQTTEIVELPEETFVENVESPEGKPQQKKTTKRIIKKKVGPKLETTQIITEQEDDETPVTFVHKTVELIHDTVTPLVDLLTPEKARIIEEAPEEVKVTEVVSKIGDKKTIKTTKRVIKKQKGPKQEVTEIITIEKDGEEPVTTVTVSEDKSPEEVESQPIEIVELPEESTIEEIKSPDGKPKQKKITKRTIKKKVGPRVDTTHITTTHEDDKAPVVAVHTTHEFTDDTLTTLDDLHEPVHAQVIEEAPEEVKVTQTVTEQGDTKTVKTTKRVIKKPKGLKQEVTEITTVENEGEEPVTTVTVTEEKSPEEGDTQTTEIVELPEESTIEEIKSPDGKSKQKKITKRTIKKKVGPRVDTTHITTTHEDDKAPVVSVHTTHEFTDDTLTIFDDLHEPVHAQVIEEAPEEVKVTQTVTEQGDTKTVKTTKRVIKKPKGLKQEVTEITTVENEGEEPVTTVTVTEEKSPEEGETQTTEIVELPEETFVENVESPEGKPQQKKTTKRIIKKKVGPKLETTQIITEQEDDETPVTFVHKTEELIHDTVTPLVDLLTPEKARIIEEAPEEVKVTEVVSKIGDKKTIKTTKRVIKKQKGPKQEVTEIITIEKDGEEPVTTVTVSEDKSPEEVESQPIEIVELPEESTIEEIKSPDGKSKQKKITKRTIKKKVGPRVDTTHITTTHEDDKAPVVAVHTTHEFTDDTLTTLDDLHEPVHAQVIEEAPEEVKVTQTVTEQGDTKTVKTTKRVIKKPKGLKQEVTEITTVENEGEEPVTTVTVTEEKSPEEGDTQTAEIVELPEESTIEEIKSPDGKSKQKIITKRTIKKKVGPRVDTTHITTTHEDDKAPVVSVHTTHEFTDDTLTTLDDLHEPVHAQVIEDAPEEVKVTQTVTEQGDTKTVKTTKRVIKKPKGLKQEVTEITTVENEGEEPVTTVTVTEEKSPEEGDTQTTEIVELPEESTIEEIKSPDGKSKQKKITKRTIKKKVGPRVDTTHITTTHEDDKAPVVSVHTTHEFTDDTLTIFDDLHEPVHAQVIEEAPEEVKVTQTVTEQGDTKTVKTTKRVIKKPKGLKQEVTEITTVENEGEEPVTTVTVTEEKSPEEGETQTTEIVELPEETFVENVESPEGKPQQKKTTKRIIKKKVGPKLETTQIITEQEDDETPVTFVHKTEELIHDTVTPLVDLLTPEKARIIEEAPEEVKVTEVVSKIGDKKTIKTTKRVIKKQKGPKQEVTEIITIEKDGEEPVTTVTVSEDKSPEEVESQPIEIVELPEESTIEEIKSLDGKSKQKKITKRTIKKKVGPRVDTTHITTTHEDDKAPVVAVHTTHEFTDDTLTTLDDLHEPVHAQVIEEAPEEVKVTQTVTEQGDTKTVKTTKRVIKKPKGLKQEVTEITTVENEGEEPVTTVTVTEEKSPEEGDTQTTEIVELPEESTIEEIKSPDGKSKQKKITKRTIKKKVGPRVDTTHITTTHEDDKAPVVAVHTTHEFTDDTLTTLDDLHEPVHAQVIEEAPEEVKVTQTVTEQGDTKTVKTTKRVIKKPKGLKQEVTEITTVENEGEEPVTTVTVTEEKSPEEGDTQTTEIVELPEESTIEEIKSPDGKSKQKKITKRTIKKKVGPRVDTTHITTTHEDDKAPVVSVHTTHEFTDDTLTIFDDLHEPVHAPVIEEAPEEVKVTQTVTEQGDTKTVKTTKRVIKKPKGLKQEVTEITTVENEGEEPVTTVTVTEEKSPEEGETQTTEIVELPEETFVENVESPEGKPQQKKTTKRIIKKKVGPKLETTQIITEQEDDESPVTFVHKTEELIHDTVTPLVDLLTPEKARIIEEAPEEVKVTEVVSKIGDKKTVKTTKRVIKKQKGPKQEVTEIITIEKDGEEPVTTITVSEDKSPEEVESQPIEIVELPEESTIEENKSPDGKFKQKKITKRTIKKKVGPRVDTTQITTTHEEDKAPVISVHTTHEFTDDTLTTLDDLHEPVHAQVIEEAPEEVKVTQTVTEQGDTKTVKTTKRVIKKPKGLKQEVTEITTVENEGEEPVTTVTVREEKSPEEEDTLTAEIVELPEESTIEEIKSPDGKSTQKKITKRTMKKKVGPRVDTTHITTTHEDDKAPVVSVHTTHEFTDDTLTIFDDLHEPVHAQVIEEAPEEVKVTQTVTEQGDTKTVKTTKRVIKKPKGLKQEVTEITTVENEGEEPVTTVTVREEKSPEEGDTQTTEIVELPEESTIEEIKSPEGKSKQKKITKRTIKKKVGPRVDTTHITTTHEDDKAPVVSVHTTHEFTDDTLTTLDDLHEPVHAQVIEEAPEEFKVTQTVTEQGDTKTIKTTKCVIKKPKGLKHEVTEITTVENEEEPVTTVTVTEEKSPVVEDTQILEIVNFPDEIIVGEMNSPKVLLAICFMCYTVNNDNILTVFAE
ncbi:titin-like [Vanessa tameamea]|uniref:Titin-like n=1 Tax=Vanessa tameamea TaxID=334116 RepID=A0ABM4AZ12_VANTA